MAEEVEENKKEEINFFDYKNMLDPTQHFVYYTHLGSNDRPYFERLYYEAKDLLSIGKLTEKRIEIARSKLAKMAKNERTKELEMIMEKVERSDYRTMESKRQQYSRAYSLSDSGNTAMVKLVNDIFGSRKVAYALADMLRANKATAKENKKKKNDPEELAKLTDKQIKALDYGPKLTTKQRFGSLFLTLINYVAQGIQNGKYDSNPQYQVFYETVAAEIPKDRPNYNKCADLLADFLLQTTLNEIIQYNQGNRNTVIGGRIKDLKYASDIAVMLDNYDKLYKQILNSNSGAYQDLKERIFGGKLDSMVSKLKQVEKNYTNRRKKKGSRKSLTKADLKPINKRYFSGKGLTQTGGKAEEVVAYEIKEGINKNASKGKEVQVDVHLTRKNAYSADAVVTIGNITIDMDIDNIEKIFDKIMVSEEEEKAGIDKKYQAVDETVRYMEETREKLDAYNEELLKQHKRAETVYQAFISAKSYNLEISDRFVFHGTSRNFESTQHYFDSVFTKNKIANDVFLTKLLNTMPGAILEDNRDEIGEELNLKLSAYFAQLLFDDYTDLGREYTTGLNAIHFFQLNGVYIPLSILLYSAAKALENMEGNYDSSKNSMFHANFETASKLVYTPNKETTAEELKEKWLEQRESAMKDFRLTTEFYANFQNDIMKWFPRK